MFNNHSYILTRCTDEREVNVLAVKTKNINANNETSKKNLFNLKRFKESIPLYTLLIPAIIFLILFNYIPMYGIQIAFRDYNAKGGITGSEWIGLMHFETFINSPRFLEILINTLQLSILSLATFPVPIIFALMLNYCNIPWFKKTVQMVTYAPHFISVVVLVGMLNLFLSPSIGIVNIFLESIGLDAQHFTIIPEYFRYIFVGSDIWQNLGWSAIIYIGTLTTVSPELHEAAIVDGAHKLQRIWHIDIPAIAPTTITMFVMRLGQLMNVSFQKVLLMQNSANISESEIISTYVYSVGLKMNNFSYATAIDLFNTIINIVLLITANKVAKKLSGTGLF